MKKLHYKLFLTLFFVFGLTLFSDYKGFCTNQTIHFPENKHDVKFETVNNLLEVSLLINKFLVSENDPKMIINVAFSIKSNRVFGDTLSDFAANFMLQHAVLMIEKFHFSSHPLKVIAYRRLANKLQNQGIPVNIPNSNLKKVLINIKQKNYHYLFNRLQLQLKWLHAVFGHISMIGSGIFAILFIVFIWFTFKKSSFFGYAILVCCFLVLGLLYGMAPAGKVSDNSQYEELEINFQINRDLEIGATPLTDQSGFPLGKLIWADVDLAGFSYHFSPLNIKTIIDSIQQKEQLLLCTTASFINNQIQPVGFTMVAGKQLNPLFHYQWNGLVSVTGNNLQVTAVKEKGIDPIESFSDYYRLASNLKQNLSDAFQVPLLVYNDSVQFDLEKTTTQFRENRFLLKVTSPDGKKSYLLADIESSHQFAVSAKALFNKLKSANCYVDFMVLFDVGANNLFQVFNSDQTLNNNYLSAIPAERANNILALFLPIKSEFSIEPNL